MQLRRSDRPREVVLADLRARLAGLPVQVRWASPLRTGWTICCPACAPRSPSRSLATTPTPCAAWPSNCARLATVPGLVDLNVEKQVLIPQLLVRIDHARAAQAGLAPARPCACCNC